MDPLFIFVFTKLISTAGFVAACLLIIAILLYQKSIRQAWTFLASAAGLMLSVSLIKLWLEVPRPLNPLITVTGYGFPSGHATGSMFIALSCCIMAHSLQRKERYAVYAAALLFVTVVGLSRIYFNVHTPIQVFGGYVLGVLWAFVWFFLMKTKLLTKHP